jgi:GT2 family glycosyltransferase
MERAAGDVWLFLDDDVELEADCVERIVSTYSEAAGLAGVSGLITNYARPSKASRLWLCCFVRGPFHDERQPLYWNAAKIRSAEPFPVTKFTGCLMSFRSDFVRHLRFDEGLHGVSEGEDVDFCLRVGGPLLLNPRARVRHHHSKSGRLTDHWTRRAVRAQLFLFGKHWNHGFFNRLVSGWLFLGYCLVCTASSLRHLSLDPWRALGEGIRDACMALARSAELQNRAPSDGCDKISVGQDT